MKNLNNKQNRKAIKGLRLLYYRVLYSSFHLKQDHVTHGGKFDPKIVVKVQFTGIIIIYLTIPILLLCDSLVSSELSINAIAFIIGAPLAIIVWLIVNYVFLRDKFIDKISQYEEVVVVDYYEKWRYIKISGLITIGLFVLWIALSIGILFLVVPVPV